MNDFDEDEVEALKKMANERMAYDTIFTKFKNSWVWVVGAGVLTLWALWDNVHALLTGVK
jgi:hypothetical protein